MRLISQDGIIDVPYESTNVSISYKEKNKIIAWGFGCEEHHIIDLGTYSSHEKAKKVMEMLREKYAKIKLFKSVYQNGLLTELNKELGFNEMQNTLTSIFKFPADEEVEV